MSALFLLSTQMNCAIMGAYYCLSLGNAAADTTFSLLNLANVGDARRKTQKRKLFKVQL